MWHITRGWRVRVPVCPPVNRGPLAIPRVTGLGSIKTTAFADTMAESEDDGHYLQESSPHEGTDSVGAESSQEDEEGLFIPSYLEEALPNDPTLQVKMAHAMQAQ